MAVGTSNKSGRCDYGQIPGFQEPYISDIVLIYPFQYAAHPALMRPCIGCRIEAIDRFLLTMNQT